MKSSNAYKNISEATFGERKKSNPTRNSPSPTMEGNFKKQQPRLLSPKKQATESTLRNSVVMKPNLQSKVITFNEANYRDSNHQLLRIKEIETNQNLAILIKCSSAKQGPKLVLKNQRTRKELLSRKYFGSNIHINQS